MRAALLVYVLSITLVACGGGGGGVTNPPAAAAGNPDSVSVTVLLDRPATGTSALRRATYLSPATQSVTVSVNSGAAIAQTLTSSGGNCSTPPFSTGPVCTIITSAPLGSDTFTFVAYDGTNGTGNRLSQNTVVQTITAGAANTVAVVLNGVPAGILVSPYPNQANVALAATGYTITGTTPATFAVVATDADGNLIVGPGAPTLTVSSGTPASLTVAPVANNPNKFTLTPVTDEAVVTLNVSAAGGNGSGTATSAVTLALLAPIPTSLPVPLYVYEQPVTGSLGEIDIFPVGSIGAAPYTALTSTQLNPFAGPLAVDPSNGTVYAEANDSGTLFNAIVSFSAAAIGTNATPTTEIYPQYRGGPFETVFALAVGPNHDLYVVGQLQNGTYGIFIMQPNASGTAAGQYQEIDGANTLLGSNSPTVNSIVVDGNGYIYIAILPTNLPAQVLVFAPSVYGNVAPVRAITGTNTFQRPVVMGVAVDGTLYVEDASTASIFAFAPGANGNVLPERSFQSPQLVYHPPATIDTYGNVYALNYSNPLGPYPIVVFSSSAAGNVNPVFSITTPGAIGVYENLAVP